MPSFDDHDIYLGFTAMELGDSAVEFGEGIRLCAASAKFGLPLTFLCPPDPKPLKPFPMLPRPAMVQCSVRKSEVTSQLHIPVTVGKSFDERFALGKFLVLLLRLWSEPAIGLHVVSNCDFNNIVELIDSKGDFKLIPIETQERYLHLGAKSPSNVVGSITWVKDNWKTAHQLYENNAEFRLAADTLDLLQFIPNPTLALVSIWGALEAIFSPSTSELRFRVSALIASYLEPPGNKRLETQKEIAALYDLRSAAAHGKPKHGIDDLLKTRELLVKVIVYMIHFKQVPTKSFLEAKLFGAK